jgi:hypothetical protein
MTMCKMMTKACLMMSKRLKITKIGEGVNGGGWGLMVGERLLEGEALLNAETTRRLGTTGWRGTTRW